MSILNLSLTISVVESAQMLDAAYQEQGSTKTPISKQDEDREILLSSTCSNCSSD